MNKKCPALKLFLLFVVMCLYASIKQVSCIVNPNAHEEERYENFLKMHCLELIGKGCG